MLSFLNTNILAALGWALLNGIWQMGLLWLVYLLLTDSHKRFSAAVRHNLAGILSLLGTCWFLCSLISSLDSPAGVATRAPFSVVTSRIAGFTDLLLSFLSVLYLLILVYQALRYTLGLYQLHGKRRNSGKLFSEPLQSFADRISPAMGIVKPVKILLADWVDTAQTIGFIKPLILLPVALLNRLSTEQVEAILLHELAHIRRNDYLFNMLMIIFRTIFFFNPFARCFFKAAAREREHACDDEVLLWNYPAPVYAEALLALGQFRQLPHALSLAAAGNNPGVLVERVRRLVGLPVPERKSFSPLLSLSLVAALLVFTMHAFSRFRQPVADMQSPDRMVFQNSTTFISVLETTGKPETVREVQVVVRAKAGTGKKKKVALKLETATGPSLASKNPMPANAIPELLVLQDEAGAKARLQYADQLVIRNFSNEKAMEPEVPVTVDLWGAPYVPPASFSVSPLADTLVPDVLLRNKLLALLAVRKIKTDQLKSEINSEISRQTQLLRKLEKENLQLIRQKTKGLQPAIRNVEQDIQKRKEAIDQLLKQLQVLGGEVIII
jgi:beta-lactamase regulating signal transducer with metallopeptidase domain